MKKIIMVALCVLFGFVAMVHAQSVEYDYAFTYIDTRVAFIDYYDPNGTKYETRVGIPITMTDPNDVIDYLSTPQMLELILVNIRHTEYPNLPVMDTAAEMFDPNNWCDMPPCDPNELPGDPNYYLQYVEYPNNYNPNYIQAIDAIDADGSISAGMKTLMKKMVKVLVKGMVFD